MSKTRTYYKHSQLVLVEFNNTCPFVEKFVSNEPITIDRVAEFIDERDGFDEGRDAITFVDDLDDGGTEL